MKEARAERVDVWMVLKLCIGTSLVVHWLSGDGSAPILLPGKSRGRRSLVGYSPWGRKESDTNEQIVVIVVTI